ncbi:MAG: hypothetical protein QXU64_02035 [Thermofilaceae archaeon]
MLALSVSIEVSWRRAEYDLITGLLRSEVIPWAPVAIDSSLLHPVIAESAPLSEDVVEWMRWTAADMAVLDGMCLEYNRLGSELVSASGDGYIPGVRAGRVYAVSERAEVVRSRGAARIATPDGEFQVPVGGKATFARGSTLAWAALPRVYSLQWDVALLWWRELARVPVRRRVRFASVRGLVAPNFFAVPSSVAPIRVLRIGITSDSDQTVVIRGRGVEGEYERVLFGREARLQAGNSEIIITVTSFPAVPAFTLEIQPADNTQTVLDYIDVFPPI